MPNLTLALCLLVVILAFTPKLLLARITPEDIVNQQRQDYETKVKNYSPQNRQKLENLSLNIAQINKQNSQYLEQLALRQGEVLDEYVRRNNIVEDGGKDGIHRTNAPVENTRYWITFAHEAVAYQKAKIYIFSLTSEANFKNDALNTINKFQKDLNYARSTVVKSQKLIEELINEP